jgi:hypothetical protein
MVITIAGLNYATNACIHVRNAPNMMFVRVVTHHNGDTLTIMIVCVWIPFMSTRPPCRAPVVTIPVVHAMTGLVV